jgi:hypothetical protein
MGAGGRHGGEVDDAQGRSELNGRRDDHPLPGAAQRAHELLARTEWLDERVAAASRVVARDLLEALDQLAAERSARRSIQAQHAEAVAILGRQAYEAAAAAAAKAKTA